MRCYIFILFTFIGVIGLNAQITGIVLNSKTNTPISNVNVYLSNHSYVTITNLDGLFSINKEIINPDDTVCFSYVGYQTKKFACNELSQGNHKVYLEETIEELAEIEISASKKALKLYVDYEELSPMPYKVYSYGAALLNDKIYVVGGDESMSGELSPGNDIDEEQCLKSFFNWENYLSKMQIYDLTLKQWSVSKWNFRKRAYHEVVACRDRLYVMGGINLTTNKKRKLLDATIECYDINRDTLVVDFITPHQAMSFSAATYDNTIILSGGAVSETMYATRLYTKKMHAFDTKTGEWYKLCDMTTAKATQGIVVNHYLYLIGGQKGGIVDDIEQYDIIKGTWKHLGNITEDINNPGIGTDGDNIYIYGKGRIYIYNIKNKSIKKYFTLLDIEYSKLFYYNHKLYLMGGKRNEQPSNALYSIDIDEFNKTHCIHL